MHTQMLPTEALRVEPPSATRQGEMPRDAPHDARLDAADAALVALGRLLQARGYAFTPSTPATHGRVFGRDAARSARDVREVLGFSRPFDKGLDPEVEALLSRAGALTARADGRLQSDVRCATVAGAGGAAAQALYFHSAWPTDAPDAVFFGPDTLRFISLARRWLCAPGAGSLGRLVDVGAGSGAGGLSLAPSCTAVVLADINPQAHRLARVNAALAGVAATVCHSDVLAGVDGPIDTIITNPPYLVDRSERAYRHGGDRGIELALRIVEASLDRLARGGRLVVYTGAPVVAGTNLFVERVSASLAGRCTEVEIDELDPDVFGEELDEPAYADVERIAIVGVRAVI